MQKLLNEELNRISKDDFKSSKKIPVVFVLENIRSLLNIGSVFRTCDAFRIEAIYLCGFCGTPPNKEIHKTALGATDTVTWKYFSDSLEAINNLKLNNYKIYAVEQAQNAAMLSDFKFHEKSAFVFGNEVKGVEQSSINSCNACLEIPQIGTKHSLNVSVSAGIIAWEAYRQLQRLI
jgi:tRNA G18 (ribose-2'-O)-methylase SpoU